MCNPAAITAIQVGGTALSAVGAEQQGKAQRNYYNYLATQNEAQADQVAKAGEINTGLVTGAAAREDVNLTRSVSVLTGAQKAASAASGVYSGSKTSEDIASDTANKETLDRAAIRTNADLQSQKIAYESAGQQAALRGQAVGFRTAGKQAGLSGDINAASSLLSGATQVASRWYQWGQLKGKPAPIDPYDDGTKGV